MKKMFVTLAALALAAAALAVPAAAHGHGGWNGECRQAVSCQDADGACGRGNYADEDGDGLCDNCGGVHTVQRYGGGNGHHGGVRGGDGHGNGRATMEGDTAAGK